MAEHKLAELINERSDLKSKMSDVGMRLNGSCYSYEGIQLVDDAKELHKTYLQLLERYKLVVAAINKTNMETVLPNGMRLADALIERDNLRRRYGFYSALADRLATVISQGDEITMSGTVRKRVFHLDAKVMRDEEQKASSEYKALDSLIQATNWNTTVSLG